MIAQPVVSKEEWQKARLALLAKEKELTQLRDKLSAERRTMPWIKVDKDYQFEGPDGQESLSQLFAGKSQLIVQHFMYGPDWGERGCKSCSFWADGYNGFYTHINQRDAEFVAVSLAPLEKIEGFRKLMGWDFKWFSSHGSDFNYDFNVSFTQEGIDAGTAEYNYRPNNHSGELPGVSVFYKDDNGDIYHTYSTYSRGLDMLNAAYHYIDLLPKGRDEDSLSYGMEWLRHHDLYEN